MAVFVIFWLILACMLEIQLSLCWLAKNLTGMSGGSHLFEALQVLFITAFIHWCRTFDYIDQIPSAFWNELFEFHRSICDQTTFRSGASSAYSSCLIPDQSLACFLSDKTTSAFTNGIRMANCQGFFASSLLWRKHVSRISPWSSVFMQGEIAM